MTRDSDGEQRAQKTVAELLAQHGGQVGGTRRRRRRAAEDEDEAPGGTPGIADTAPQAIIDRIRAEGPPPARNGHEPPPPAAKSMPDEPPPPPPRYPPRQAPPPQGSGGYPVPAPEETGRRPLPPRAPHPPQQSQPMPVPPGRRRERPGPRTTQPAPDGSLSARLDGLGEAGEQEAAAPPQPSQSPPPPQGSGGYPIPPRRRRPPRAAAPPPAEPNTEQFPAVPDDAGPPPEAAAPPAPGAPVSDEPPAGLAGWRQRRSKGTGPPPAGPEAHDDTEVGLMPAVPPAPPEPDAGPQTGHFVPDFEDEDEYRSGRFDSPGRTGVLGDDPLAGDGEDYDDPDGNYRDYEYTDGQDDYGYDDEDQPLDADDEESSPAKQWLALAGQLALGVVGGAGVWLGFNWLWGRIPAAALIAALVITVVLVLIVRKVRRAEDLQTTVLALLVGLVVTVSPAALLLVSR